MMQRRMPHECRSATLAEDRTRDLGEVMKWAVKIGRSAARGFIRAYQLTLSALVGSRCRYLPTCSAYVDEAIARHGLWAGGFMGVARLCRCHPFGGAGFDPVPLEPPANAHWLRPWRYGVWRGPQPEPVDAPDSPGHDAARQSRDMVNEGDRPDAARPA